MSLGLSARAYDRIIKVARTIAIITRQKSLHMLGAAADGFDVPLHPESLLFILG